MTTTEPNRTPAGSPDGGKFAPGAAGAEADAGLLSSGDETAGRQAKLDREIDHIIMMGRTLNDAQVKAIHSQYKSSQPHDRTAARRAAVKAAGETHDHRNVIDAAQSSGADAICYTAAHDAARAASAEHLISDDPFGFTQEHYDRLTAPWDAAGGVRIAGGEPLWNSKRVEEATSKGYIGGSKEFAQLGSDVSPADGLEAATRMLGTNKIRFAGFRLGYPTYEKC